MPAETLTPLNSHDHLFDPNSAEPPLDLPQVNRMVEAAAVRRPNLGQVLDVVEKDSAGMLRPNEAQSQRLVEAFSGWRGFGYQPESETGSPETVARAKELVAAGQAANYLRGLPFIEDNVVSSLAGTIRPTRISLKSSATLSVNPEVVVGAMGFNDWQGRGYNGASEVADRQSGQRRKSIEQIFDYATRETPQPAADDAKIFITDQGAFVYAGNAHRAAATKLRGEAMQISSFDLWDLRGQLLSDAQQQTLAKVQSAIDQAAA